MKAESIKEECKGDIPLSSVISPWEVEFDSVFPVLREFHMDMIRSRSQIGQ